MCRWAKLQLACGIVYSFRIKVWYDPAHNPIYWAIPDSSTTSQCSAILPSSILYRSADFIVTFLPVCLFVPVVVGIASTLSPSATNVVYCCTWIWKCLKESSTSFFEAFCSHYLPIMLYWLLCKVAVSCSNILSSQYILDKVAHKLLVIFQPRWLIRCFAHAEFRKSKLLTSLGFGK